MPARTGDDAALRRQVVADLVRRNVEKGPIPRPLLRKQRMAATNVDRPKLAKVKAAQP